MAIFLASWRIFKCSVCTACKMIIRKLFNFYSGFFAHKPCINTLCCASGVGSSTHKIPWEVPHDLHREKLHRKLYTFTDKGNIDPHVWHGMRVLDLEGSGSAHKKTKTKLTISLFHNLFIDFFLHLLGKKYYFLALLHFRTL